MKKIILSVILLSVVMFGCIQTVEKQIEKIDLIEVNEPLKVEFPSLDSLMISALIYEISEDGPVILLCHQARFNKFEYEGIAQKLNERGFNCVAIDQRSGGSIVNSVNETTLRALEQGLPIDYLDAEQDIIAAINYVSEKYQRPVILWGSSYSSTLAIYQGVGNNKVKAVVSFSPGNYFAEQKGDLAILLSDFEKPMFITSSKQEIQYVDLLLKDHKLNENQIHFKPSGTGHHGSRALWKKQTGGEEYWDAIDSFLEKIKK